MELICIDETDWVKDDYRSFAAFDLEIEHFEKVLGKKAYEYEEDGLGPAKAFMCKFGQSQVYIRWLEFTDLRYKTTIELLYPFVGAQQLLDSLISQLQIKSKNLTWKYSDT